MTSFRPFLYLIILMSFGMQAGVCCAETQPDYDFLVIPLDKSAEFTASLLRQVEKVMAPFTPPKEKLAAVSSFVTDEGCYVLHGDLFGNAQRFVLLELNVESSFEKMATQEKVVGLAKLNAGRWELCALLNVAPVWRPKGWKESENDYLPITPTERPFELEDSSDDGVPEVILAAEVNKYYQQYFMFRWDAKTKSLMCVADSMAKPVLKGGYVILYSNSGRRAIWEEWRFCQWEKDRLIERASWHEEVPYNGPEEPFMLARRMNADGTEVELKAKDGEWVSDTESVYQITRQEKPFARVTFKWSRTLDAVTAVGYYPPGEESACLFEKLTGLSRKLYPANIGEKSLKDLEKSVKILIEGEPAAVQMLSPR
ncbi:MAG: hypothetical protein WAW39_14660 [Prosthecobacter sp.]|uniref:hypothetical protein n=1 Tax=Prosthecobacter sp. TaxID=1965333 RepID=UPI003BAFD549